MTRSTFAISFLAAALIGCGDSKQTSKHGDEHKQKHEGEKDTVHLTPEGLKRSEIRV